MDKNNMALISILNDNMNLKINTIFQFKWQQLQEKINMYKIIEIFDTHKAIIKSKLQLYNS